MSRYSDAEKLRSTNLKLVVLHKEFNHQDEVISCYDAALATYDFSDPASADAISCSELWMEYAAYVLNRDVIPEKCWEMVCLFFFYYKTFFTPAGCLAATAPKL